MKNNKLPPEDTIEFFIKNHLSPQMTKNRQIINLENGIVTDTPLPEVIKNMYGYCFKNEKIYKYSKFGRK